MKVFYVDDERFNLLLFRKSMPPIWDIQLFANPSELLAKLEIEVPDVIISDEHMEEMCGSEMLEKVHFRNPEILKIIITGKVDIDHLKTQVKAGQISYFLGKPYDPKYLIQIVEKRFPRFQGLAALEPGADAAEIEKAKAVVFKKAEIAYEELQKAKKRVEYEEANLQDAISDLSMHIRLNVDPAVIKAIAESVFNNGGSYNDFQDLIWRFARDEKGS